MCYWKIKDGSSHKLGVKKDACSDHREVPPSQHAATFRNFNSRLYHDHTSPLIHWGLTAIHRNRPIISPKLQWFRQKVLLISWPKIIKKWIMIWRKLVFNILKRRKTWSSHVSPRVSPLQEHFLGDGLCPGCGANEGGAARWCFSGWEILGSSTEVLGETSGKSMFRWCFGTGILGSYMAQMGSSCGLNHPRWNLPWARFAPRIWLVK